MVSHLVFYQLALIAVVWVFLMLYGLGHDPTSRLTCETRGEPDVKTQRS